MSSGYKCVAGSDVGHEHAADPRTVGCFLRPKRKKSTAARTLRETNPDVAENEERGGSDVISSRLCTKVPRQTGHAVWQGLRRNGWALTAYTASISPQSSKLQRAHWLWGVPMVSQSPGYRQEKGPSHMGA